MQFAGVAEKIPEQRVIVRRVVVRRNRLRYLIPYLQIIGFLICAYILAGAAELLLY